MNAVNIFFLTHLSKIRQLLLGVFGLFTLFIGWRFYQFYQWTIDQGGYVPRPPSVEAFLPISALLAFKRLVLTGEFDFIHPAGLVIFIAALVIAFAARKGFCGWICPVGFISHLIQAIGTKFKIQVTPPRWITYLLTSIKYLLLFFFLYVIGWQMDVETINAFLHAPYNLAADVKMMLFFLTPSKMTMGILFSLFVLSLVIAHFWCRFLCPYGALLGLIAFFSPFQIHRDQETCIDCQKCNHKCPGGIQVSQQETVRSPECIGCLECIAVCPKKGCLSITAPGKTKFKPILLPIIAILILLGFWATALLTNHWQSTVSPEHFKQVYQMLAQPGHL